MAFLKRFLIALACVWLLAGACVGAVTFIIAGLKWLSPPPIVGLGVILLALSCLVAFLLAKPETGD